MRALGPLLILLLLPGLAPAQSQQPPAPAVTVVAVEATDITPSVVFTGRIEAIDKVELMARVDGFLEQRRFEEGGLVRTGELLFVIEKGLYQAQLDAVDADIAAAEAAVKLAELDVERQSTLVQRQAIAQSVLDQARAQADEARAQLQRAQASRTRAELDLGYTDIKAPIDGRIGRASVSVGDYVGPNSGPLATLVSQDPVYVTFPVTQRQLLSFRESATSQGDTSTVTVRVRLADGRVYEHAGRIDFVDVQVDPGTDTIAVRAILDNPDALLIDQQLVTALVETATPRTALVVPQRAVLADQGGRFVLVVGDDNTVEQRPITVGQSIDGGRYAVTGGLEEGERVITEGIQRVRPGMTVDPAEADKPAADGA